MDTTTLWAIFFFAFKVTVVGAMAFMLAVTLWMVSHELRSGSALETGPDRSLSRAQAPLRYWLHIVRHILFIAGLTFTIHVFIQLGERREQPSTSTREELPSSPAPARPNDESYDRADVAPQAMRL